MKTNKELVCANCAVTTGIPHQNKAPRLVLIHHQFVVGTATDLLHLPKNYKL